MICSCEFDFLLYKFVASLALSHMLTRNEVAMNMHKKHFAHHVISQ